jgi:arabinoxylan arabinofuranohydrolase
LGIKKILSGITAAVCCAGILAVFPEISYKTYAAEVVHNDFEVDYEGWYGNADSVNLTAKESIGYEESRGMLVSGRTTSSDGVSSAKGFYLSGGISYDYSVKVYSESSEHFRLSLLCINQETDEETTVELTEKDVKAGEWTELSAVYTAPSDSYEFRLTITTDSTSDFRFDEVLITTKDKKSTVASAATTEKGLKDEFASYFRVGNILNGSTVQNSAITANIIKDYNSIECENEMKPDATMVQSQSSGTNVAVSLSACASIMDFCVKNNIAMRGHTLVWHSQTPEWFFKENFNASGNYVSSDVMDQRMESYIKNMFTAIAEQYPSLNLYAYDVANECISDDSNRTANYGGAREAGYGNGASPWVQVYGDNSFVEKAFTYARKYAPEGCALYYNDYNEYWDHKRDAIYEMCKSLYEKGLLDGVGMQSHIPANATGFAGTDSYIEAMKKYLSIGCDVQVTELDISLDSGTYTLQQQADKYKAIFQAAMDWNTNPQSTGRVTAVCIWGPNDANSWLSSGSDALLYDSSNQPKLAYTTLTSMIPESEWGDGTNISSSGTAITPNEYGWYFDNGFESDVDGWTGRGAATVESSSTAGGYVGDKSLYVSGRTASWNGAEKTLSSATFKAGTEYSFSVNVKYTSGTATDTFYMKLQYVDGNGDTQYATVAEATAIKGEWVQLVNTNYTIPSDATNMKLYIETADSTTSFYMDEAIAAVGGTGILGAGSQTIIYGDVNSDGVIDCFDVALARKGVIKGFSSSASSIAADVNKSGTADVTDIVLLQNFVLGRITEFPEAETTVTEVDTAAMEQLFSSITPTIAYKDIGENNPLYTQRFGADPGVMEYNGRVYVYTTNDAFEYDSSGNIQENTYNVQTINCISSDDLVNWTDHGVINVAGSGGAASWASCSWAPAPAHKTINGKEKFFLYFANSGGGIGVLTADSPEGPWTDPIGHALITGSTTNCSDVLWLFDPAVLVDDDGSAYIYFGGGVPDGQAANPKTARVAKLGDDMISLSGTPQTIDAPYLFEDSGINKINGKYYYSYCTNWNTGGNSYGLQNAQIAYMVSDNPMGPFTYSGVVMDNPAALGGGGNNHHFMCTLNGKLYMFYHARSVENDMGINLNYRSPMVNEVTISSDGSIKTTPTMAGVSQLKTLNPYSKIQAETIYRQGGINVSGLGDTIVTDIQKGDWIGISGADFSNGAKTITVNVSSSNGGAIKVCTGSENGNAIGYIDVPATGGKFVDITSAVSGISGTQDIYLVFSDEMEIDYWYFS